VRVPEIPTGKANGLGGIDPFVLLGIMAFPKDTKEGDQFVARLRETVVAQIDSDLRTNPEFQDLPFYRIAGELFGSLLEPLGGFSVLLDAPTYSDLRERVTKRTWPGCIAGDLLFNLLQLRGNGLSASVNKAIEIDVDFLSRATNREGFPGLGKTVRYVRKAWEDFKPACHLWAAYRIWDLQNHPVTFAPHLPESVDAFLALSQALLSMAASLQAPSRREPILNTTTMWTVSQHHQLPAVSVKLPPLQDWKSGVLRRKFKSLRD